MPWYTLYMPQYIPLHTLHALLHTTCLGAQHCTPYMPWNTLLDTLNALICTTCVGRCVMVSTYHYTPYMPWYTPHALVHTTCLGTHYYTPYMLAYTTTHLSYMLCTHHYTLYMLWYIPLHTLHSYLGCTLHNSSLHHVQLHPKKKDDFEQFFLNNSNSIRLTKVKLTVYVVCTLAYIYKKIKSFYDT